MSNIIYWIACFYVKYKMKWMYSPEKAQNKVLKNLITRAKNTQFGKTHHFQTIQNYAEYKKNVPLRYYEDFLPYIDQILSGQSDVLWPGKPLYIAKTSGTTAHIKYIPISKESIGNHIRAARNALLSYMAQTRNTHFIKGKMMFLQGSPVLEQKNGLKIGRLSGIVAHHVPFYLQKHRLPSYSINCMENWEEKVEAIVDETLPQDLRVLGGIPIWMMMYFEKLLEKSGQENIKSIFKNFSLLVYGGVNYQPYQNKIEQLIGCKIDCIELYPTSEGFLAFQNDQEEDGLLLILNDGIFYEFVPLEQIEQVQPMRFCLEEVILDVNYAIVLSTNAGLWAYVLGDTVKFTNLRPYKIKITGRTKHFISAFGEHVIAEEVEGAIQILAEKYQLKINEFTVAPEVNPTEGKPYHEWFIEWDETPSVNLQVLAAELDTLMQEKNIYYSDLIQGNILQTLKIKSLAKHSFEQMMQKIGKLGGQNKVPRLANHREYVLGL
jgi:phenylacetate-coenzyme A ligase PaaK-like adenylate-forming protein